jgi:hypothetical protein
MKSCLDSWSVVRDFRCGLLRGTVLGRRWTAVRGSLAGAGLVFRGLHHRS